SAANPFKQTSRTRCATSPRDDFLTFQKGRCGRWISPGEIHLFRISLNRGLFLKVILENVTTAMTVRLMAQGGEQIASYNSSEPGQTSASLISEEEGTYAISVSLVNTNRGNHYRLWIDCLRKANPQDADDVKGERAFEDGLRLSHQRVDRSSWDSWARFVEAC